MTYYLYYNHITGNLDSIQKSAIDCYFIAKDNGQFKFVVSPEDVNLLEEDPSSGAEAFYIIPSTTVYENLSEFFPILIAPATQFSPEKRGIRKDYFTRQEVIRIMGKDLTTQHPRPFGFPWDQHTPMENHYGKILPMLNSNYQLKIRAAAHWLAMRVNEQSIQIVLRQPSVIQRLFYLAQCSKDKLTQLYALFILSTIKDGQAIILDAIHTENLLSTSADSNAKGLRLLIENLTASNPLITKFAVLALFNFILHNQLATVTIINENQGLPVLMPLLTSTDPIIRQYAIQLVEFCAKNVTNQDAVVDQSSNNNLQAHTCNNLKHTSSEISLEQECKMINEAFPQRFTDALKKALELMKDAAKASSSTYSRLRLFSNEQDYKLAEVMVEKMLLSAQVDIEEFKKELIQLNCMDNSFVTHFMNTFEQYKNPQNIAQTAYTNTELQQIMDEFIKVQGRSMLLSLNATPSPQIISPTPFGHA